ncbi:major capsid protein [Furfurilactobacillus sp. WILCCON 0119]
MATMTDLFPAHDVLDYTNAVQTPAYLGSQLFPNRKVRSNDIKMLTNGTFVPTIAHVHALDTEAEMGSRSGEISSTEPFFVKRKMVLNENDLLVLNNPRSVEEQNYIKNNVYNDLGNLLASIEASAELMRMQALMHGKLALTGADGNAYSVDYKINKAHQGKADFSDAKVNPIEVIESWADQLDVTPTRAVMSTKALAQVRQHPLVIAAVFGNASGRMLMQSDLDTFMEANGLPVLRANKAKYRDVTKAGKHVTTPFIADGDFAMFADGVVGETVYGVTPEESRAVAAGDVTASQIGNVMVDAYEETHDPIEATIKASAMMMPTLAQRDNIFQAQVL